MKPFDLEKAKAGKPVCTKDGRPARIVCYDRKGEIYPIVALVEYAENREKVFSYTENGRNTIDCDNTNDLVMAAEKKEGWINIYGNGHCSSNIYPTERMAITSEAIATVKVEWEE